MNTPLPPGRFLLLIAMAWMLAASGCARKTVVSQPSPSPANIPPRTETHGTQKRYTVLGQTYTPVSSAKNYTETGVASWYGKKFHGRLTASGEIYDMHKRTAAHRILPMHTRLKVTNLDSGKETIVMVNDRGPFAKNRILDLSFRAAKDLGVVGPGTARVRISTLGTSGTTITGPFYVQVGAFTVKKNALVLRDGLRSEGYDQTRLHSVMVRGKKFWQVHAGRFRTLAGARQAKAHLADRSPSCFILAD
ncbi:septal ring lytic transglycosylase RlpA family protein [Desulfoplanes sp.]